MKDLPLKFLRILPFLIVFIASLYNPNDSDLGWYLKYGEYFAQHHTILRDNTFSSMMPNYQWVNHSWVTDILSYNVFHAFGFWGLNILAALSISLTFYFFAKAAKLTLWEEAFIFPVLLYLESPLNSVSFRAQILSFLFLGILFYILSIYEKEKSKKLFWIIPLFLIWANFHGEFVLGLIVLGIWSTFYIVSHAIELGKNKVYLLAEELKIFIFLFILLILATLINPFGIGIYVEIFRHFFNPWQKYIAEWLPFEELSRVWWNHIIMGTFILVGFISLFFTAKWKQKIPYLGIISILFILSFLMRRYAWPLYYMSLPLIATVSNLFKPPSRKIQNIILGIVLPVILVIIIFIKTPFDQYISMSWEKYCAFYRGCSPKAVAFLIKNQLTDENLFTLYDWGGWLIWNYPEIKPTIDGRMVLWQDEKGYSAFAAYYPVEQDLKNHDIEKTNYNVAFISPSKPVYHRLMELAKQGKWKLVYNDTYAGIFVRGKK